MNIVVKFHMCGIVMCIKRATEVQMYTIIQSDMYTLKKCITNYWLFHKSSHYEVYFTKNIFWW